MIHDQNKKQVMFASSDNQRLTKKIMKLPWDVYEKLNVSIILISHDIPRNIMCRQYICINVKVVYTINFSSQNVMGITYA